MLGWSLWQGPRTLAAVGSFDSAGEQPDTKEVPRQMATTQQSVAVQTLRACITMTVRISIVEPGGWMAISGKGSKGRAQNTEWQIPQTQET